MLMKLLVKFIQDAQKLLKKYKTVNVAGPKHMEILQSYKQFLNHYLLNQNKVIKIKMVLKY